MVSRTNKGTAKLSSSGTTLTLAGVTIVTGRSIQVTLAHAVETVSSVVWGAVSLTKLVENANTGGKSSVWVAHNVTGATSTVTVTFANPITNRIMFVDELGGDYLPLATDVASSGIGSTSTFSSGVTAVPLYSGEYSWAVVAIQGIFGWTSAYTAGVNFPHVNASDDSISGLRLVTGSRMTDLATGEEATGLTNALPWVALVVLYSENTTVDGAERDVNQNRSSAYTYDRVEQSAQHRVAGWVYDRMEHIATRRSWFYQGADINLPTFEEVRMVMEYRIFAFRTTTGFYHVTQNRTFCYKDVPLAVEPATTGTLKVTNALKILQLVELPQSLIAPNGKCLQRYVLRILRASDLLPVLELDEYEYLNYTRRLTDLDEFELRLSLDTVQGKRMRTIGIAPSNGDYILNVLIEGISDFSGFMDRCSISLSSKGEHVATFRGNGLDRMLADRIVVPPDGVEHDSYADAAESVIKQLVDRHLINPVASNIANFNDATRAVSQLLVSVDNGHGLPVTFEGRFQRLIDAVKEVSQASNDIGTFFTIIGSKILFEVSEGIDRTKSVIFGPERNNVISILFDKDGLNYASHILLAGQDVGTARQLTTVYDPTKSFIQRRETFIDARDLDTVAKLTARGDSVFSERSVVDLYQIEKAPGSPPCYKEHFELGDTITVLWQLYGINVAVRIYEVNVGVVAGQATNIRLTFGKLQKQASRAIKNSALPASSRT